MNMTEIETTVRKNMVAQGLRLFKCTCIGKDLVKYESIFELSEMVNNLKNAVAPNHPYFKRSGYYHITEANEITLQYK